MGYRYLSDIHLCWSYDPTILIRHLYNIIIITRIVVTLTLKKISLSEFESNTYTDSSRTNGIFSTTKISKKKKETQR